jgi:hypothetical protein
MRYRGGAVPGEFVSGGVEPKLLPKLLPVPDPELEPDPELKLLPKLELPTGVEVLLAGWPIIPVLPAWVRISVNGS